MKIYSLLFFINLLIALACTNASATGLKASPVHLFLSQQSPVTELDLTNTGKKPITIALKTVRWTQNNGKDSYGPTEDLLATPPIAEILPNQMQIVRIGLETAPNPTKQTAYRLFVREVPSALEKQTGKVRIVLQLSLPLFVSPLMPENRQLQWIAKATPEHALLLTLINQGNTYIQTGHMTITNRTTHKIFTKALFTYLLPGNKNHWIFPLQVHTGDALTLKVLTDSGEHFILISVS